MCVCVCVCVCACACVSLSVSQKAQLAPNVMAMVNAFNSLAYLVSTEVLTEETPQERAKVISAFIKV